MSDARLRTYYRTLTSRLTLPFVFTRCLCGCVLGFAAIAKTMDDASAPSLAIAQIEMGLAAWALTGGHDAILRRLLLCLFLVFATVNAVDALGGRDTCNCFGALNARPGAVALLDTTLAAILFISPPPLPAGTMRLPWLLAAPALLGLLGPHINQRIPRDIWAPEEWTGRRLPLLDRIHSEHDIELGDWTLLFVSCKCESCRQVVRTHCGQSAPPAPALPTPLCVVYPSGCDSSYLAARSACFEAHITSGHQWPFRHPSPLTVVLNNGIVERVLYDH